MNPKPIIISVAPNGARKSKKDFPTLPISPQEILEEAGRCVNAGATLFHLHVRDDLGGHSLDTARYREAIDLIKAAYGDRLIIQASTETVEIYEPKDQMRLVTELVPPSASIGVRELVPNAAHEMAAANFLAWSVNNKILLQYICYSSDDIVYFSDLLNREVIPKTSVLFLLFVLGKKTGQKADVAELAPMLKTMRDVLVDVNLEWAVCAFGDQELPCMLEAVREGGHVRIGFENNHMMNDGTVAKNTAELVRQFVITVKNRPIALFNEAKFLLESQQ
ncbi:MAG: 3-keto-5-aminohexanoate cleavage protein [Candidatus Margulisbacteria bacterium]|nr:3-keto-5-aminohexanoate cleavage protein [Candidatus Margulisiibacteriota bacterium]